MVGRAAEDEGFTALAILAAHAVLESLVNQLGREEVQSFNERARFLPKWRDLCQRTLGRQADAAPDLERLHALRDGVAGFSGPPERLNRRSPTSPREVPKMLSVETDVGRSTRPAGWSRSSIYAQVASAPTDWTGWHEAGRSGLRVAGTANAWAALLSTDPDPAKATTEAAEEARVRLGGSEVSLAVLVTSRDHDPFADVASEAVSTPRPAASSSVEISPSMRASA